MGARGLSHPIFENVSWDLNPFSWNLECPKKMSFELPGFHELDRAVCSFVCKPLGLCLAPDQVTELVQFHGVPY